METLTSHPRKAIIYVRVSSADQVEGTSLDDQETRCAKYCTDNGYIVVQVFREEGASAKSAERAKLLEAMEYCRKHKGDIAAFVVWKVDRFARNTEDHFGVRKILADHGTRLVSVTEPIGNGPGEKLFETILAGFAEFDNAIRRQRCSNGMKARLAQKIWPFKPPPGYVCEYNRKNGKKKTEPDKPHPQAFPLIQRLIRGYLKQVYTQTDIMQELQKARFEDMTGRKASMSLADRILGQYLPFYAGLLPNPWPDEFDGAQYLPGAHEPMITVEEMREVRRLRTEGVARTIRDRNNPKYPLRRLVLCECGRSLTGSSPRGRRARYAYYHCYNRECRLKYKAVAKDTLESEFVALLRRVTPTPEFLEYFHQVVLSHWNAKVDVLKQTASVHEKALKELEAKKKTIFEMRENREYTTEQFRERMEHIENMMAVEKIAVAESRTDQYDLEGCMAYAKHAITNVAEQWLTLNPTLRARFQKLIFPEGIRYTRGKGFGTIKLGRIFALNETFGKDQSLLVDLRGIEPRPPPCHGGVIPIYYRPVVAILPESHSAAKTRPKGFPRAESGYALIFSSVLDAPSASYEH